MGDIVQFNPSKVPARIRENAGSQSALTRALAGGSVGGGGVKRISIKGGVFRLMAGNKEIASIEERKMPVVIVNAAPKVSRVLYLKQFDPSQAAAGPDCWSNDGEKPDASIEEPQADRCAECPQNVAGSGAGNSRKCRYQQRIAVSLPDDLGGDVLQMIVPGASVFGKGDGDKMPLQAYARYLAGNNIDINDVVTEMRFDTKAEAPKLFFKPLRFLDDVEHETAVRQGESDVAKRAVVMTAYQAETTSIPDAPKLEGKKPVKAVEAVEDDEDEDQPSVRKSTKKAAPAKSANMSQLVAEWDDE